MNPEDNKDVEVVVQPVEKTELELVQEKLAKTEEERDNYKKVALQRKGKLPADTEFFKENDGELSVAEQVRLALLDREVEQASKAKEELIQKQAKELSELRLAFKNRPGSSIGSDSGSSSEVKDNVFSQSQIDNMTARAKRLNIDPATYIDNAKKNLLKRS